MATKPKPTANVPATKPKPAMVLVQNEAPSYINTETQRGSENVGMADLVIPRLEIVQGLSPAVKRGDPGYIQGAAPGMLNNSVTRKLYGDSALLVPVHYSMQYLVWRDRKLAEQLKIGSEGGFFGAYSSMEEAQKRVDQEGGAPGGLPPPACRSRFQQQAHVPWQFKRRRRRSFPRRRAPARPAWAT